MFGSISSDGFAESSCIKFTGVALFIISQKRKQQIIKIGKINFFIVFELRPVLLGKPFCKALVRFSEIPVPCFSYQLNFFGVSFIILGYFRTAQCIDIVQLIFRKYFCKLFHLFIGIFSAVRKRNLSLWQLDIAFSLFHESVHHCFVIHICFDKISALPVYFIFEIV